MTPEERHLEVMKQCRELNKRLKILLCLNITVLIINVINLIKLIYG